MQKSTINYYRFKSDLRYYYQIFKYFQRSSWLATATNHQILELKRSVINQ